jgi:hypothetical protein
MSVGTQKMFTKEVTHGRFMFILLDEGLLVQCANICPLYVGISPL